ncbi:MAG: flagellar biosynthesis protein FlhB [bacterium]|nr:flagellar biosynthesis protein FlhB [bacterium]
MILIKFSIFDFRFSIFDFFNPKSKIQNKEFDLQLFARAEDDGRTEEPTTRKIQRARARGQVSKSKELTAAGISLITILIFTLIGYFMFTEIVKFLQNSLSQLHTNTISYSNFSQILNFTLIIFLKITLPIMLIALFAGLLFEIMQAGIYFAPLALMPDFTRLKPNFPRVFTRLIPSKAALIDYGKTFFKIAVITIITYQIIKSNYSDILLLIETDLVKGFFLIANLAFKIALWVAIFLLLMSIFDYFHQRHEFKQNLMMSKHELKDEWRQLEGDPLMRGRVRERMRQMATKRMMAEVPGADVIITNPIHLALAIKYESAAMRAPTVVAKGKDLIAQRIVEIARGYNVPVVENKPLAEALFETVEIGVQIPAGLYHAVAEILAYVYQLKQKKQTA